MPSKLLLTLTLLLVLGGIVGAQAYQLYRNQLVFESSYEAPTLAPIQITQSGMSLEQIAGLQLFGNAKTAPIVEDTPKEMPKTDLKLVLVGAINSTDTKESSALIQNGSETKRYFVGDNLSAGVELHEVRKNEVVLKRDNRFETLSFPKLIESAPAPLGATHGATGNFVPRGPARAGQSAPSRQGLDAARPRLPGGTRSPNAPLGVSGQ